jgi:DNA-binding CsgD family transcriptional regulator
MVWDEVRDEYFNKFQSLTKREKEILRLIALGHSNKYIGDLLCISFLTVKTHRRNIRQKLETSRLDKLIRIAEAFGLI